MGQELSDRDVDRKASRAKYASGLARAVRALAVLTLISQKQVHHAEPRAIETTVRRHARVRVHRGMRHSRFGGEQAHHNILTAVCPGRRILIHILTAHCAASERVADSKRGAAAVLRRLLRLLGWLPIPVPQLVVLPCAHLHLKVCREGKQIRATRTGRNHALQFRPRDRGMGLPCLFNEQPKSRPFFIAGSTVEVSAQCRQLGSICSERLPKPYTTLVRCAVHR